MSEDPGSLNADGCARVLLASKLPQAATPCKRPVSTAGTPTSTTVPVQASTPANRSACSNDKHGRDTNDVLAQRVATAEAEAVRMLSLDPSSFPSRESWGFAVLGLTGWLRLSCDTAAVQRSFRTLMRKLHPDRVGPSKGIARALDMLHEAKAICERALSWERPPSAPRRLTAMCTCAVRGHRRVELKWDAPESSEDAPVSRYVVSALDPAYGRPVTLAKLEPDYNEKLGRFVPLEEIDSYSVAEEDLAKLSSLFRQSTMTLQVAAANDAGQSPWATVKASLVARVAASPRA